MVQIIPRDPTLSDKFGEGLALGISQGLEARLSQFRQEKKDEQHAKSLLDLGFLNQEEYEKVKTAPQELQKMFVKQKVDRAKALDSLADVVDKRLKNMGPGLQDIDADGRHEINEYARKAFERGAQPNEAVDAAIQQFRFKKSAVNRVKDQEKEGGGFGNWLKALIGPQQQSPEAKVESDEHKISAVNRVKDQEKESNDGPSIWKTLKTFLSPPTTKEEAKSDLIGALKGPLHGLTLGYTKRFEPLQYKDEREAAQGGYGEALSSLALLPVASKGINAGAKLIKGALPTIKGAEIGAKITGWAGFGALDDTARSLAEKGKLPSSKELAINAGLFGSIEAVAEAFPYLKNLVKRSLNIGGEDANKVLSSAMEKASKEGANIDAFTSDPGSKEAKKAAHKINRILESEESAVTKAGKENMPRVDVAKDVAERAENTDKIKNYPLEDWFKLEKDVKHRPETLERHKAIDKRIGVIRAEQAVSRDNIKILQRDAQEAKGLNKEVAYEGIGKERARINDLEDEIKRANYEKKYGRAPPTIAEIKEQIDNAFKSMKEEIKNPTKTPKQLATQAARTAKVAERATNLARIGDLPTSVADDMYLQIRRQYGDAYKEMADQQKKIIEELKGAADAESKKRLQEARQFHDDLQSRIETNKNEMANQTAKLKTKKMLSGPSGAFYKNRLKDLRQDVTDFQRQLFRQQRLHAGMAPKTLKTKISAKKAFDEIQKTVKETSKSPEKAVDTLTKETGVPKTEWQQARNTIKETIEKEGVEEFGSPESEAKVGKVMSEAVRKAGIKKVGKAVLRGAIIGMLQGLTEEVFGKHFPQFIFFAPLEGAKFLHAINKGDFYQPQGVSHFGLGGGANYLVHNAVRLFFDWYHLNEYKNSLKSPDLEAEQFKKLKKSHSSTYANRIRREARGL